MSRRTLGANVVEVPLHDFSGGFTPRMAATEFTDRQWARLEGVVLESPAVLRSQWAVQRIGQEQGFKQAASIGRRIVAIKDNGEVWTCLAPLSWQTHEDTKTSFPWEQITEIDARDSLQILCQIPLPDEDAEGFTTGLLINDLDADGSAYAVYLEVGSHDYQVKEWSDRFPGSDATEDVMPPAQVGAMWNDFLVLGDILWFEDADEDLSPGNSKQYAHGLWFSEGDRVDKFEPLGVIFTMVSDRGGRNHSVLDLIAIDAGLLVITHVGLFLLRGTPDDFVFEPIRWGISSRERRAAAYWPYTGSVVFVDNAGQVWQTNGELFERADKHLHQRRDAGDNDHVETVGEHAIVERHGRLFCFTAFDEDGAWTELLAPGSTTKSMFSVGDQLYFLDDLGKMWRFNRRNDLYESVPSNGGFVEGEEAPSERGLADGEPAPIRVATRTLETGAGHSVTFWHRFGFKCSGPGKVGAVDVVAGAALADDKPRLRYELDATADKRERVVLRAHGPSNEASAVVELEGDVQLEQFAFWVHEGKGDR